MSSISKIYIIDRMHKHTGVKNNYNFERKLRINNETISLLYCDICDIYMCPKTLYDKELKNTIDNKLFKTLRSNDYVHDTCYCESKLNNIKINKMSSFSIEHEKHEKKQTQIQYNNKLYDFSYCIECDSYGINDEDYDYIKNKFVINKPLQRIKLNRNLNYDLRRGFYLNHMEHKLKEVIISVDNQDFKTLYCANCDLYQLNEKVFAKYIGELCTGIVYKDDEEKLISRENNSIEFLIKINTFRCQKYNHKIEEIIAIVNVFDKNTEEIKSVEIPAFYCKNCGLYFIYGSEYDSLLKYGIPICPIHEEVKYFNNANKFEKYETNSLLRQFGYNVNSQENLSVDERRKIINSVIKNGIMTKNDVLSLLNFLSSSRKNQLNMKSAVSKWEADIKYTRELVCDTGRKVNVGAFRKKKIKSNIKVRDNY